MRTVLLVGAGGSLAQAQSLRPARVLRHPPLDGTFFGKANALAQYDEDVAEAVVGFNQVVSAVGVFANPMDGSYGSLEQFFADVYYEVASRRSEDAFEVFKLLLQLYIRVLAVTTNWMSLRTNEGVLGKIIRREVARALPDRVTVITFNQDLVIENVVARIPRLGNQWCLEGLYGDVRLQHIGRRGRALFPFHQSGCVHQSPVRLLKLHGSLNWAIRTIQREPQLGTLFPTKQDKVIYMNDEREAPMGVTTLAARAKGRPWYLWPLVVPPIYDKQRITGMTVLQELWNQAEDAIEEAERLVLIGYSLPEADVLARQSIRRGYLANRILTSVDSVNPDVGVAAKLKANLDCKIVRVFDDAETYLEHGFEV